MKQKDVVNVGRRSALVHMGSLMAVGFLASCSDESGASSPTSPTTTGTTGSTSTASTNAQCVVTPALTEGPYFVDERLNRSDIRTDPSTGQASQGVLLNLIVALSKISTNGSCSPLAGALVDMWHCDILGVYSDVQGAVGQRFLRGYQTSDASGLARFTTIYPGWYQGRAVHIHFKARTNPDGRNGLEFTSQMFFDEALTDVVHTELPYSRKGRRDTLITGDGICRSGGSSLLVPLSGSTGGGYSGTLNVGVRV
jgi:protocatechuate 3,4-dioxygenase beta subunit